MDSHWIKKLIFISLIVAIAVPNSSCYRRIRSENTEQYLRDLCSKTHKSDVCWNILKPDLHKFDGSDDRDIADNIIDLTISKTKEIRDKLNKWFRDSNNDKSKGKYRSCSKNYDDVARNLEDARRDDLDSDDQRRRISKQQIKDSERELEKCKRLFRDDSFDPTHVVDRNNELELYLDMSRVAVDRLRDYFDDDCWVKSRSHIENLLKCILGHKGSPLH